VVPAKLRSSDWQRSAERDRLFALYAEADALLEGWRCTCSEGWTAHGPFARCCHFGDIGREPYPTAVELEEVLHAVQRAPLALRGRRTTLPLLDRGGCPLLSREGRCSVYASRPFGCRTFFCDTAEAPFGARARLPRAELREIGRRIADLSARFAPHDPHPRPLARALAPGRR
jgi:uncharacterized protein